MPSTRDHHAVPVPQPTEQPGHLQPLENWPAGELVAGLYRIQHRLGFGGFGEVYLASDEATHRLVAIKVPYPVILAAKRAVLCSPQQFRASLLPRQLAPLRIAIMCTRAYLILQASRI